MGRVLLPISEVTKGEEINEWNHLSGWFPLSRLYNSKVDDTFIQGDIYLELQYKYPRDWTMIYQSLKALDDQDWSLAIRLINESIDTFPDMQQLYGIRSALFLSADMIEESMYDATKAATLSPNNPEGYYRTAMVHFKQDNVEKARELISEGLVYDPDDQKCNEGLLMIEKEEASVNVRRAISNGRNAYAENEFDLAHSYFSEAIRLSPGNFLPYLLRVYCSIRISDLDTANKDAQMVVQLNPNWPKTDYVRAGYLQKAGNINMMFKKRWVVYKEPIICYYEGTKDLKPKGITLLANFDLGKKSKKLFRVMVPGRSFEYKAETEEDRDDWVTVLEKPLNLQTSYQLPQFNEKELEIVSAARDDRNSTVFESVGREFIKSVHSPLYIGKFIQQKIKSTLLSTSLEGAVKYGHLYKMGSDLGLNLIPNPITKPRWAKRFVILKEQSLFFLEPFKINPDPQAQLTPASYLSLNHTTKVLFAAEKAGKDFAFEVYSKNSCVQLSAGSKEEMNQWVVAILEEAGSPKDAEAWMDKFGEKKKSQPTQEALKSTVDFRRHSAAPGKRLSLSSSGSREAAQVSTHQQQHPQDKYKIHEQGNWGLSPATFNNDSPSSSPDPRYNRSMSMSSQDYGERTKQIVANTRLSQKPTSTFAFPDERDEENAPLMERPNPRFQQKKTSSSCCSCSVM